MEFDLWNEDFLLSQEWALETPDVKISGHLDDKVSSHPLTGDVTELKLQDALNNFEALRNEDVLGLDWMESTDISSLLATLGEDQDNALSVGSSAIDIDPSEFLSTANWIDSSQSCNESSVPLPVVKTDSFLSPPESPGQSEASSSISITDTSDTLISVFDNEQISLPDLYTEDLTPVSIPEGASVFVGDISSLSFTVPSSPDSSSQTSQSSLIESSPELYKVICTNSPRSSPYPTSTPKRQKKTNQIKPRKRQPAQPVPEHIIMEEMDKKDRKKLQNKNAAIRYRMKKKEEAVDIVTEEKDLEDVNTKLKTKVDDLQREIKYMKSLMKDICKAKGIAFNIDLAC